MKHLKLRFYHPLIGLILIDIAYEVVHNAMFFDDSNHIETWILAEDLLSTAATICYVLLAYAIIQNAIQAIKKLMTRRNTKEAKEMERQREIELKEINMVRKSNEILLHLIQDEHREEDR